MPSEVRVVGQEFYAKLNNGDTYSSNASDFATHLKGGVLEEIKAVLNVQIGWSYKISGGSSDVYYNNTTNEAYIRVAGKDFATEGFAVGDDIKVSDQNWNLNGTITSLSIGEIYLESVVQGGVYDSPNTWVTPDADVFLIGLSDKTALKYSFGLIENNENIKFLSKLTNEDQTYVFENINHSTPMTFVDGVKVGVNKADNFGSAKVAYVGNAVGVDYWAGGGNAYQEFQVEHIFKINPFFRTGEEDSIQGLNTPPTDLFASSKSLKYVFKTEFRTTINNPNTAAISEHESSLGSVGYFGESFNGYTNDFSVENVSYGSTREQIEVGETTSVSYDIVSSNSNFTSSTPVVIGHVALVDSSKYRFNNSEDFKAIWNDDQVRALANGTSFDGDIITNCVVTVASANRLNVSFDCDFNASQSGRLEVGQNYILYYTIADTGSNVDTSNKVTNVADFNQYLINTDVDGLFDADVFEQFPHPLSFDGINSGFSDSLTFNESGQMLNASIWVLNGHDQRSLDFDISILDKRDNSLTQMRSLSIDITDAVVVNGIKQINIDSTRNYILNDDDIFNYVRVTTGVNDGTKQYYDVQVGYKIPWQEWIELNNAPTDFYDVDDPNYYGLNQKASNYSMKGTGDNVFVDGDGGTFEDSNTSNWDITMFNYSAGTPNQVGGSVAQTSAGQAYTGEYAARVSCGGGGMVETSKIYEVLEFDSDISVEEGCGYEVVYYVAGVSAEAHSAQLDNAAYFIIPEGYSESDVIVDSFEWRDVNLSPDADNLVWKKCTSFFKATSTGTVNLRVKVKIIDDINASTGGAFYIDGVSTKKCNHQIRAVLRSTVDATEYAISSEEIYVFDYDRDEDIHNNYSCEINTYNIDGVQLNNNIINKEFTEIRAEFTPIIEPVFTKSLDFTEVSTNWTRFAHGNLLKSGSVSLRLGLWENDQANDTDTFADINGNPHTKGEVGLYTSTTSSIVTNQNCHAFYGCSSIDKYEFYTISGEMYSNDALDNDSLAYTIGFLVDDEGIEHTLSLVSTTGGVSMDKNPSYSKGDDSVSIFQFTSIPAQWALIYDYGKDGWLKLDSFETTKSGFSWGDAAVQDLIFDVNRSGANIEASVDWIIDGQQFTNTFNYNLNDNDETKKFIGHQSVGFSFMSQAQGGFKNVVLTVPENNFYGILRIDRDGSSLDTTVNQLSSLIEAPEDNLLKQVSGVEKLATLSWDGTKFVLQGLVETELIVEGYDYRFSAELRNKDLEA